MKRLVKTFENFQIAQFDQDQVDHQNHHETENYMFFGNLETIKRYVDQLLEMNPAQVDEILTNGHNWAVDHIVSSKDDIEEVYNFLVNEVSEPSEMEEYEANEAIGTLLLLAGGALAGPGLIQYAKNMYQKHIVARQFEETGETKKVGKATFRGYEKDGEHYWGIDYTTRHGGEGFGKTNTLFFTEDQLPAVEQYLNKDYHPGSYDTAGEIADDEMYALGTKAKHSVYRGDDTWKRKEEARVSEMYKCDECNMTYEAHEVNEDDGDMMCECGGTVRPMNEKW
jgi:hypothetical protein